MEGVLDTGNDTVVRVSGGDWQGINKKIILIQARVFQTPSFFEDDEVP